MSDVTRILCEIEQGDPSAAEQLLPLVYDELRKLAAQRMAQEAPDHTLQATALVHEAYIRLVDAKRTQQWESRGHFFAAAVEAMRRILVENSRRKRTLKRGGRHHQVDLELALAPADAPAEQMLALSDALDQLEEHEPQAAQLVKLRYFGGLGHQEAADMMGIRRRAADRIWALARAWLFQQMSKR